MLKIPGVSRVTKTSARITVVAGYDGNRQRRKTKTVEFPKNIIGKEDKIERWLIAESARFLDQFKEGKVGDRKHTLDSWMTEWLEQTIKPHRKITTYSSHKSNYDLHIKEDLGNVKLSDLTPSRVQKFANKLAVTPKKRGGMLSPVMIGDIRRTLSACLECAVKHELMVSNPVSKVEWPSESRRRGRALDKGEYEAFCTEVGHLSTMWQALFHLMASTGMRRGEAVGLNWDHIDLEHRQVHIVQNAVMARIPDEHDPKKLKSVVVIQTPKTQAGIRTNFLNDRTAALLRKLRSEQMQYNLMSGIPWKDECAPVFLSDRIEPDMPRERIRPDSVTFRFEKICKNAGIENMHLHDLRHSFVSAAIHGGASVTDIARQVGHASTDVTLRVYSHAFGDAIEASKNLTDLVQNAYDKLAK